MHFYNNIFSSINNCLYIYIHFYSIPEVKGVERTGPKNMRTKENVNDLHPTNSY